MPGDDDALDKWVLAKLGRANGPHWLAERVVAALLRSDMPLRLAKLARVPKENRVGFWLAVFGAVLDAWEHEALRGALNALRAAAVQVVDECSPYAGPSNGAVERLRAILDENLMKTI